MTARDLTISWFPTGMPQGPAIGDPECTTWGNFAAVFGGRREGEKDGPNFVPARFKLEPDGKHVRRLARNLIARTAIAMDCETNKKTGEMPPAFSDAIARVRNAGWGAIVYTSHNHAAAAPRYRIVLPLAEEIDHELPAIEVVADRLQLAGVLDTSKVGGASVFYMPSCNVGELDNHHSEVIDGYPIDAEWIREATGELLAERRAVADRIATEARAQAEARRQAKIASGFDPEDSLIEKLRSHLDDLEGVLLAHSYDKRGTKFRHPNSQSGSFGADIKIFGGIPRVFSHNANDPLHAGNLPEWCGGVTALDALDTVIILDFGGDRNKALRQLADRFGLTKAAEKKKLTALLFHMIRDQAAQRDIEAAAFVEGVRLGLSRAEVCGVACWVAGQAIARETA